MDHNASCRFNTVNPQLYFVCLDSLIVLEESLGNGEDTGRGVRSNAKIYNNFHVSNVSIS